MELINKTARDVVGMLQSGEITPGDCLDALEARVAAVDGQVNALPTLCFDRARERAPNAKGILAGLPVAIKDLSAVEGVRTTYGSPIYKDNIPARSDHVVEEIESHGGLIFAKTNTPEFGAGASTFNQIFPTTRNPWNLERAVAGSSGGSAALVAAGVVPIAHANDGGGSIRIPAAACGLVGLKPSRGRIRQTELPKVMPIDIAVQGVVSRSVRDTAMFVHGAEQHHRNPDLPAVGHVTDPLDRPIRIGAFTTDLDGVGFDSQNVREIERVAALCESLGHHVEMIDNPFPSHLVDDFLVYWGLVPAALWVGGTKALHEDFDRDQMEPWTKHLAKHFRRSAARFPGVVRRLRRFEADYRSVFERYDVLLSPTLNRVTPSIGYLDPSLPGDVHMARVTDHISVTPLQNASGGAAISLPLATDDRGLPLGIHFGADVGAEALLLQLALQLEAASPWPTLATA